MKTITLNSFTNGKRLKDFYEDVVKKPAFFGPFLIFSILAYLPSIVNTKRQFEDFHMEVYMGNNGVLKTGRWAMYYLGNLGQLVRNDNLNKALGLALLILGAVFISSILYCVTDKKGIYKYTVLSTTIVVFPLINEIWSYNLANLMVCLNIFLVGSITYYLLISEDKPLKKMILASFPFAIISSSYESGLFVYVSLICGLLFYLSINNTINIKQYISIGIFFAIPLIIGTGIGVGIGHLIALVCQIPYDRHGDATSHWQQEGALKNLLEGNLDKYFLRGFVYVPIGIFVISVMILVGLLFFYALKRKGMTVLYGCVFFISLFLLSFVQGNPLPYRVAQNISLLPALLFFIILETCENKYKIIRRIAITVLTIICYLQSAFLMNTNLIDYQSAHNDENLVRQIGFELTSKYYGKPVILVGHYLDGYNLSSSYLHKQIIIDSSTFNGKIYTKIREKILGSSADKWKYYETNLWSVLYLMSREADNLEQFFAYCGYNIDLIPYANRVEQYPEVTKMIEDGSLHPLEIIDMGDYVVVSL